MAIKLFGIGYKPLFITILFLILITFIYSFLHKEKNNNNNVKEAFSTLKNTIEQQKQIKELRTKFNKSLIKGDKIFNTIRLNDDINLDDYEDLLNNIINSINTTANDILNKYIDNINDFNINKKNYLTVYNTIRAKEVAKSLEEYEFESDFNLYMIQNINSKVIELIKSYLNDNQTKETPTVFTNKKENKNVFPGHYNEEKEDTVHDFNIDNADKTSKQGMIDAERDKNKLEVFKYLSLLLSDINISDLESEEKSKNEKEKKKKKEKFKSDVEKNPNTINNMERDLVFYDNLPPKDLEIYYENQRKKVPSTMEKSRILIDPLEALETFQDDIINLFNNYKQVNKKISDNINNNKKDNVFINNKSNIGTHLKNKSQSTDINKDNLTNIKTVVKQNNNNNLILKGNEAITPSIEGFETEVNMDSNDININNNNSLSSVDSFIEYLYKLSIQVLYELLPFIKNIDKLDNHKMISYGVLLILLSIVLLLLMF